MSRPWLGLVVALTMLAAALVVFPMLPDRVPTHWNAAGEPDAWGSKWPAAFLPVGVALGIWALLHLLPRIDPRQSHYEDFHDTYWLIGNLIIVFMALLQFFALATALGWPVAFDRLMLLAVGLFFMALGRYLPRVRSNWWLGIRTPWTLSSESVWRATHRLAGRTFVVGGLILMAGALLSAEVRPFAAMAGIGVGAIVPAIYSYFAWRREKLRA